MEARVQAEKGGLVSIKLEAFDISTDPCMPQPSQLQYTTVPFFLLVGILLVCLFSTQRSSVLTVQDGGLKFATCFILN